MNRVAHAQQSSNSEPARMNAAAAGFQLTFVVPTKNGVPGKSNLVRDAFAAKLESVAGRERARGSLGVFIRTLCDGVDLAHSTSYSFARSLINSSSIYKRRSMMAIVLYHHPFSRAAGVLWMLEEVEVPYELRYVDITAGAQKAPEIVALNPMGKLPILTEDETVVTESAAIGLYLADRHAPGRLAPRLEDPARGTYLRWSLFAPSVIEPGSMAKMAGWQFREGQAGWGSHAAMVTAIESAITGCDFILGNTFSMADVIFGGTLRFMVSFNMLEPRPVITSYIERLNLRPALVRAEARNAQVREAHGLKPR